MFSEALTLGLWDMQKPAWEMVLVLNTFINSSTCLFYVFRWVLKFCELKTWISQCNHHIELLYYWNPITVIAQKNTIHQVTTMLASFKNVLFPGHNHQYWWPDTLIISWEPASEGSSVPMVSKWLWPGNRTFLEVASMVVTWRIVAFLCHVCNGQLSAIFLWNPEKNLTTNFM